VARLIAGRRIATEAQRHRVGRRKKRRERAAKERRKWRTKERKNAAA
jgi:hypothetical protein